MCRLPESSGPCPLLDELTQLFGLADKPLRELEHEREWTALCNVLTLHAIADESGAHVGLGRKPPKKFAGYVLRANDMLVVHGTLSSFEASRVRILPKLRTPQTGISIRSLSLYTAYTRCEVSTKWRRSQIPVELHHRTRLRLLLFPWPFEIKSTDFVAKPGSLDNMNTDRYGFFDYDPRYSREDLQRKFTQTLTAALHATSEINAVVLPECALTDAEYEWMWNECVTNGIYMLLAGVRGEKRNEARLQIGNPKAGAKPGKPDSLVQHKHHRWCLDGSQINNYRIGDSLSPAMSWWEHMDLHERELTFVAINDSLTFCHLICEDLARIDPVAQVVRAVGPTFLIALLLDGPQLKGRWPGRYSSVLADDPGTSVLTLTSLGMAERSLPNPSVPPNRTIAFWKDARYGDREILIDDTASAVVLTVWLEKAKEFSADGRNDDGEAGRLIFGGTQQVVP